MGFAACSAQEAKLFLKLLLRGILPWKDDKAVSEFKEDLKYLVIVIFGHPRAEVRG